MANISGQKVYLADIDLSSVIYDLSMSMGIETLDDADWADTTAVMMAGLKTGSFGGQVRYTTGATGTDTLLHTKFESPTIGPASLVMGTAENDATFTIDALMTQFGAASGGAGDRHSVAFNVVPAGDLVVGRVVTHQSAATATGNSTGFQFEAVDAGDKLFSILHVFSNSGGGTLDVVLESDDAGTFLSPTSVLTHTQASGTTSEILTSVSTTTDDYWRSDYTIASGTWGFVHIMGIMQI